MSRIWNRFIYDLAGKVLQLLRDKEVDFRCVEVIWKDTEKGTHLVLQVDTRLNDEGQVWIFHSNPESLAEVQEEASKIANRIYRAKAGYLSEALPNEELLEIVPARREPDLIEACTKAYQVARSVHWRLGDRKEVEELSISIVGTEHPLRMQVHLWKSLGERPNTYFFKLDIDSIVFGSQKADEIVEEICKAEGIKL